MKDNVFTNEDNVNVSTRLYPVAKDYNFDSVLTFYDLEVGKEIGRLYSEDGRLKFKGVVDESAKVFFNYVLKTFN